MFGRERILRSPRKKDEGEGSAAEPLGRLETIPGFPDDLQMIGQYLLLVKRELEDDLAERQEDMERAVSDPMDVESNIKRMVQEMGLSKREAAAQKKRALDTEYIQTDIDAISTMVQEQNGFLEQLKRGDYQGCLDYLKLELEGREMFARHTDRSIPNVIRDGSYWERYYARNAAIREYMALLQKKMEK